MTAEANHLIAEFVALPEPTKHEVLAELLRIARKLDYPELADDELTAAANERFRGYDVRESRE